LAKEVDPSKAGGVAWADIEARKSFVGLFLQDAMKRGEDLSEDYLRDLVLNFLIAGRDTTAQALSWALFCLCQHPEAAAKARSEALEVCGSQDITYDAVNRLPYLQAVLNEALRLYPSVPLDIKLALEDDVWPDGTQVRRGNMAVYNIYAMGRDPALWGADAEEFRPERWLEMDCHPDNYKYPVFNAGPRECLGKRLAQVEMKTCLAVLLPRLSFKLAVPAREIIPDGQLTIGMGRGLPCFVEPLLPGELGKFSTASSTCASSRGGDSDQDLESLPS
jgi:fatty acid omega-hydroxylase